MQLGATSMPLVELTFKWGWGWVRQAINNTKWISNWSSVGEGNGCHKENGTREAGGRRDVGRLQSSLEMVTFGWRHCQQPPAKDHQENREVITLGFWLVVRDSTLRGDHEDHGATQRVLERTYSRIWTWVRWFRRASGSRTFLWIGWCQEWGQFYDWGS